MHLDLRDRVPTVLYVLIVLLMLRVLRDHDRYRRLVPDVRRDRDHYQNLNHYHCRPDLDETLGEDEEYRLALAHSCPAYGYMDYCQVVDRSVLEYHVQLQHHER